MNSTHFLLFLVVEILLEFLIMCILHISSSQIRILHTFSISRITSRGVRIIEWRNQNNLTTKPKSSALGYVQQSKSQGYIACLDP